MTVPQQRAPGSVVDVLGVVHDPPAPVVRGVSHVVAPADRVLRARCALPGVAHLAGRNDLSPRAAVAGSGFGADLALLHCGGRLPGRASV